MPMQKFNSSFWIHSMLTPLFFRRVCKGFLVMLLSLMGGLCVLGVLLRYRSFDWFVIHLTLSKGRKTGLLAKIKRIFARWVPCLRLCHYSVWLGRFLIWNKR